MEREYSKETALIRASVKFVVARFVRKKVLGTAFFVYDESHFIGRIPSQPTIFLLLFTENVPFPAIFYVRNRKLRTNTYNGWLE